MGLLEQAATDYSCTYKYNSNEFAGSGRKVVKRQQEAAKKWCAASSIWYHSGDRGIKLGVVYPLIGRIGGMDIPSSLLRPWNLNCG